MTSFFIVQESIKHFPIYHSRKSLKVIAEGDFLERLICGAQLAALIFFMSGCSIAIEGVKGFAAVSTKSIEEARKEAITKTFNYDYNTCLGKVKNFLVKKGSYIYAQNAKKHMIAIYISAEDTTPVGIFFKEIDSGNTQVEVSSPSTYGKELIAKKVFSYLEDPKKYEDEKGQIHAEEPSETEAK